MGTTIRSVMLFLLFFASVSSKAQILTYSETFIGGSPATIAQADGWYNYVASLAPLPYTRLTFSGGPSNLSFVCTNPTIIADIALSLRTSVPKVWVDGPNTWRVGVSGSGGTILTPCYELSVNVTGTNACSNPIGHTIRPCIGNSNVNWGGMGTLTCGAPTQTITVEFFAGTPCTDTPKTTLEGPTNACFNRPYTIKPATIFADANFDWEYSFNGLSWSKYTGPVDAITGGIYDSTIVPKWYRLTITCQVNQALKYTLPIFKVNMAPFYYCYCINSVKSDEGNDIGNITLKSGAKLDTVYNKAVLTTGTGLPEYNNNFAKRKYSSYIDSLGWPCLYRDTAYTLYVSQIHSGTSFQGGFVQAYIDFNRDGLYDPLTEKITTQSFNGSSSTPNAVQLTFTVPADTNKSKLGPTGMRVILSESPITGAPCDTIDGGGEVEDYVVTLCPKPCTGPVDGGIVVSTDTGMCKDYEYTVTDTTYSREVSAFSRAWQVSGDNISWTNVINSLNKDTLQRVFDGQPLYYRLRTICQPTHDTAYSPATLVNVKPTYKCYCYSKAIGGLGFDSSDIGGFAVGPYSNNAGGPHLLNMNARYPRTDYTDLSPIELYTDSVYSFLVYHTMPVVEHGDAKVTIFMDFDNNHQYDIPEERVYTGFTAIGNHTLAEKISIPFRAITDLPTGMRIILNNNVGPNVPSDEACGGYTSGETEDYIVIFRDKRKVSIENIHSLEALNVYPNPASGSFNVQFAGHEKVADVNIRLTNVTGQLILERNFTHNGGLFNENIDITSCSSGVYFVEVTANGEKYTRKLTIR